jgi:hypothetical protein
MVNLPIISIIGDPQDQTETPLLWCENFPS